MKTTIYNFLGLVLLISCESAVKDFTIKKPENKINIVGFAMNDSTPAFYITHNLSLNDPLVFNPLSNAKAELYENDNLIGTLSLNDSNWFTNEDYLFEPGKDYILKVSADGYNPATANFSIPEKPEIVGFKPAIVEKSYANCSDCSTYYDLEYSVEFMNQPNVEEYYSVQLSMRGKCNTENFTNFCRGDTLSYNGAVEISTSAPYIETTIQYGNQYYNRNADEFAYGTVLYFSDRLLNKGKNFLNISTSLYQPLSDTTSDVFYTFTLKKIEKSMFDYVYSMGKNSNADGNPFVQPVSLYSNIENGLGLVSGSSQVDSTIRINGLVGQ
jgi:hypothetical protein